MTTIRQSFRRWWQPPGRASERELHRDELFPLYRRGGMITIISALLILLLGLLNLPAILLLILLVLLMIMPVVYGIKVWIKVFGAEEIPII